MQIMHQSLSAVLFPDNVTEYTGDLIPESAVAECLSQAQSFHAATLNWLKTNKSDLL